MTEHGPEFERANVKLGWLLFAVFAVLFAATFVVALVYTMLD